MGTGVRKAGEFCWINVLTSNPAESKAWFSKVLGWTYADLAGMGDMIKVDGHQIGGMFDLADPNTPGTPPLIGVMVKTDDADATSAKANSLGGNAKPAFDIMDAGRMAEIKDPSGAQIDVWQPKKNDGTDADKSKHGAPSWYENYATDAKKAADFYRDLFGWTVDVMPMPGMGDYTIFSFEGVQIAGMMGASPQTEAMPQIWATYFTVDDVDKTAALATELGGSLYVPPMDIPNVGRFSGVTSPQGVKFFIITYFRQ